MLLYAAALLLAQSICLLQAGETKDGSLVFSQVETKDIEPIVIVHGGAGDATDEKKFAKMKGVKIAAKMGYEKLQSGGSVLEAVEEAIRTMEADKYFSAGYGSMLTIDGTVEMDASIMDGKSLNGGSCTLAKDIYHPITLAKTVMLKSNHTFMGGPGLMKFAREQNFEILPSGSLVTEFAKKALDRYKNKKIEIGRCHGTVGAVAIDKDGNVAAGTSTGGLTGKLPGRIGDTSILGSGTYADNSIGAISVTGHGEMNIRYNVAQRIIQRMNLLKEDPQIATQYVLDEMKKQLDNRIGTGAITLSRTGKIGIYLTASKMAWAYRKGNEIHSGFCSGDHFIENV